MADLTVTGEQLRAAVGVFPTGVTVVTALDGSGGDIGLTVSAFSSLSLDPAMVVLAVDNSSSSLPHLREGAPVGVSVLAQEQGELARRFSQRGIDRFAGVDVVRRGPLATIAGAAAWFTGSVVHAHPGGDHTILTVAVHDCGTDETARPLLYQRGRILPWPED